MSTTEEKATDSADAPAKKDEEQRAVSAESATSSESAEETAGSTPDAEVKAAPDAEQTAAAETTSMEEAGAKSKAAGGDAEAGADANVEAAPGAGAASEADGAEGADAGDELEIEVEAAEPDPIAELEAKVAELEAGKKTNYDRFLRASADLENFRKRSRRDVKDARLDERGKILRDMLPVIDNLDRAVVHAQQTELEATKSIVEGVNLVLRQFKQALERHNVTPLDAVGKAFDPALHEAVSQAPSADHPPGTIISALQTGYMSDGRLLRPALVVVSVAMPAEAKPAAEEAAEVEADAEPAKASAAEGQVIDVESSEASSVAAPSEDTSEGAGESASEGKASVDADASEAVASAEAEDKSDASEAADANAADDAEGKE